MTSRQQTITGELRKWHRSIIGPDGRGVVVGKMYNDELDIWEDGEHAVIHFDAWVESVNFCLAVTKFSAIKCSREEEVPDAKGNRSSGAP